MIEINNLSFSYDNQKKALENINIKTAERTITAILGHDGAGKTTLLKCIMGLLKPSHGLIKVDNMFNDMLPYDEYISYLPDKGGFYSLLTPWQNLIFRGSQHNKNKKEVKELASDYLHKLELNNKKNKISGMLSKGMQRRLALACTLINQPKILILDEPTNGIDQVRSEIIISMLKELKHKCNSILINTHDLVLVGAVCDSIIVLNKGKLIEEKKVEDIGMNLRKYYLDVVDSYKEE